MFNSAVLESIEQNKQQQQPSQSFRQSLEQRLAEQQAAGTTGTVRVNDQRFANEVHSDTSEHNAAPPGSPLSGAVALDGRPLSVLGAQRMDPREVLVTYQGTPMRLATAEQLGLVAILEGGVVVDRTQQQPAAPAEITPAEALKAEAHTDETAAQDVAKATDGLQRGGFDPSQVVARAFTEGTVDPLALDAIAAGLNVDTDTALAWISNAGKHLIGSAADAVQSQGFDEVEALQLIHDAAAADPKAFAKAAMASWSSGTVVSVLQRVAAHIERQQQFGAR